MVKLYNQVNVLTVATRIVHPNSKRTSLVISNIGDYPVYIGTDNQVSTTNGFKLPPGNAISLNKALGDNPDLEYWAVSDGGTGRVAYLEQIKYD